MVKEIVITKNNFLKKFPNADLKKFYFDKDNVYYKVDEKTNLNIESENFWRNSSWVDHLNLTDEEYEYWSMYGKRFIEITDLLKRTREKMKYNFIQKYPNANIKKFHFHVDLTDDARGVLGKSIWYKETENDMVDIKTKEFRENYIDSLYWMPRIWGTLGTLEDFKITSLQFDFSNFKIYVNNTDFFDSHFPKLDTKWKNSKKSKRQDLIHPIPISHH